MQQDCDVDISPLPWDYKANRLKSFEVIGGKVTKMALFVSFVRTAMPVIVSKHIVKIPSDQALKAKNGRTNNGSTEISSLPALFSISFLDYIIQARYNLSYSTSTALGWVWH